MSDAWISAETEPKERDFRGILDMHVTVCKGIFGRITSPPYVYVDLYAGPGWLEYGGRRFPGSPLIAEEVLTRAGIRYEAVHFERDPEVAERLAEALWQPTSLMDVPDQKRASIQVGDFRDGFSRWLDRVGPQPRRYGLVYSDPIKDPIPYELLNRAAKQMPKVDLLSYVSATQYKRRRGQDLKRNGSTSLPVLGDHIAAVDKRVALIRKPLGPWQWTFVLWSNWVNLPQWEKRGFYRLDSETGQRILDTLNLTAREQHAAANTPLPIDELPYHSYAEYLRHPRFLAVRAEVFARAAGRCERCGLRPPTEPHHLRYPPWGTFDVPENIIAICHQCHCEIHGKAS